MVDKMVLDHGIDARRVYITGLSVGVRMALGDRRNPS